MLKKFLISLVLFVLCFLDTKNGFEITAEDTLNKNNTQNIKQTEPHFDLPKKDAKEQCDEVERVTKECKDEIKLSENENSYSISVDSPIYTNGSILQKCGNIYLISSWDLPDTCTSMVIINNRGQYSGIKKRCQKWKDIEYFYMDSGYIGMIYDEREKQKKSATILKTKNCHIISSFNNY